MARMWMMSALLAPAGASAADESADVERIDGREIRYAERTELDLEGVELVGELVKPKGIFTFQTRQGEFNPLIRLRSDWKDESRESVDQIK